MRSNFSPAMVATPSIIHTASTWKKFQLAVGIARAARHNGLSRVFVQPTRLVQHSDPTTRQIDVPAVNSASSETAIKPTPQVGHVFGSRCGIISIWILISLSMKDPMLLVLIEPKELLLNVETFANGNEGFKLLKGKAERTDSGTRHQLFWIFMQLANILLSQSPSPARRSALGTPSRKQRRLNLTQIQSGRESLPLIRHPMLNLRLNPNDP